MEQRSEPRIGYFARVKLCSPPPSDESDGVAGMIEDRSKSGLAIRVRKPMTVGSEILVLHGRSVLRCEVKRCVQSGTEFMLGVRLLPSETTQ